MMYQEGDTIADSSGNQYTVQAHLGSGDFAEAYKVICKQKSLVLKIPRRLNAQNSKSQDSCRTTFVREVEALSILKQCDSKYLVKYYGCFTSDGRDILKVEYIHGISLKGKEHDPLNEKEAITFVKKIASGLKEIHRHNLVHRDIKPSNIIVNEKGDPVIIDLGFSRAVNAELTSSNTSRDSMPYMAPEIFENNGELCKPDTDIYSLSGVLYFLLTGENPVDCKARKDKIRQDATDPVESVLNNRTEISPKTKSLILKGMKLERSNVEGGRPKTLDDWLSGLKSVEESGKIWHKFLHGFSRDATYREKSVSWVTLIGTILTIILGLPSFVVSTLDLFDKSQQHHSQPNPSTIIIKSP